ncbi:MAG: nucleotidyltransferase [Methylophilaceae bacterium]|nr:nucleotidyltransferase [Methylophilaceae bacterium]
MTTTVDAAFNQFNKDIVNLDSNRTKTARSSRDWLISQLEKLPDTGDCFPNLYDGMHIKFGSFARNTKIRPLDDIDLILTFSADGATYTTYKYGEQYTLSVPNTNINLWALTNDDGTLNSIKMVNKLVNSLGKISHYSKASIHRRQEAATLQLTSYEWNFDIVPAFYTDTGYYLIPDGNGDWKATDPRIDQENTSSVNQMHSGKILQIIRTLKYWQKRKTMPTMSSYLFEVIILDYFSKKQEVSNFIDLELRDFWGHLNIAIYSSFQDPKGFSGELNNLSFDEKSKISTKASEDSIKASEAIRLETQVKDQEKAIKKWAEIFGGDFPSYG